MLIDFRELFPKYNLTFNGVLHIGANVGEERDVYEQLGIHRQVWIEANSEFFKILENNLVDFPFAEAHNYCIGDVEGKEVMFHVSNNRSQSSSILELALHKVEHPDVDFIQDIPMKMRRVDQLGLNLEGADLLNIDLQGADLLALKGLGDLIRQFKAVYIEVNKSELYKGCALVEDIDFYLGAYGFEGVEVQWARNKSWGDKFYIKK